LILLDFDVGTPACARAHPQRVDNRESVWCLNHQKIAWDFTVARTQAV
jgi:hypothetical protein